MIFTIRKILFVPILLATALLMSLLISCESVLFIELEEADKLIVVNSAISPDSLVTVQVSRSRHILDNANINVLKDASVNLFHNDDLIENLTYLESGFYSSSAFKPSIGEEYTIEVENEGFHSVISSCVIPAPVEIISIDTSTITIEYTGYDYYYYDNENYLQFDLTIEDPADLENYYLLNLSIDRSWTEWRDTTVLVIDSLWYGGQWNYFPRDSIYPISEIQYYTDIPNMSSEDIIVEEITQAGILFSDQLIDGRSYSLRGQIMYFSLESAEPAQLSFQLHSISESYYKYLKSRQKQYETREDYLAVPVIVYNNIESGAGFFGGYSSDIETITTFVPEYRYDYWYYEDWKYE